MNITHFNVVSLYNYKSFNIPFVNLSNQYCLDLYQNWRYVRHNNVENYLSVVYNEIHNYSVIFVFFYFTVYFFSYDIHVR